MKLIKIVYDSKTEFIKDLLFEFEDIAIIESYNTDHHKERKHARVLQTAYGSKNLPLVVFEDENQEGYAAIWSENNPDWIKETNKFLNYV